MLGWAEQKWVRQTDRETDRKQLLDSDQPVAGLSENWQSPKKCLIRENMNFPVTQNAQSGAKSAF